MGGPSAFVRPQGDEAESERKKRKRRKRRRRATEPANIDDDLDSVRAKLIAKQQGGANIQVHSLFLNSAYFLLQMSLFSLEQSNSQRQWIIFVM